MDKTVAFASLGKVGTYVGNVVQQIEKEFGLSLNNLRILGHSVGAHIAGTVGLALKQAKLVVGLDPPNVIPQNDHVNRISAASGKRVEVSTL